MILHENYQIPWIECIFAQLKKGNKNCWVDISFAYQHMPMDDESNLIQTLSIHSGLYKSK